MSFQRPAFKITTMLAALAIAGAALAGCSTGTTPEDQTGSTPETESTPSYSTNEEFQLAFAECMREQGIDMPDPGSGGSQIEAGSGAGFQEAAATCFDKLGEPPAGSGGARPSEEQHQIFLDMAACFREHGLDVPDPAPGESLTVPMDAPQELFDECATAGVPQ